MSFCLRPNVCKKCGKPLTMFEGWTCLECEKLEQESTVDVLDKIRAEIEQYNRNPRNYPVDMISIAVVLQKLDAIKDLEQEPRWIPVSERLPTREEYIESNGLFIVSDGNRSYAEYFDIYDKRMFGEPTMEGFRVDRCVSAWMPLPKPYEPQESEDKE